MGSSPSVSDWYTPSLRSILNTGTGVGQTGCIGSPSCLGGLGTQAQLNSGDWDLGAGGVVLLNPVGVHIYGSSASEYIASGKEGIGYLGFYSPTTSYMGHLDGSNVTNAACTTTTTPSSTSGAVAQCFPVMNGNYTGSQPDTGNRATPAFLGTDASDNYLYVAGIGDNLRGYSMCSNGLFNFPVSGVNSCSATAPAVSVHQFGYPGASPVVSWNRTGSVSDAIVWVLDPASHYGKITYDTHHNATSVQSSYAALYAYKAVPDTTSTGCSTTAPCMTKLWDSTGLTPPGPGAVKFAVPTVVDGMVIVGGGNNNPYYSPGTTVGTTTKRSKSSPSQCGAIVISHN